MKEKQMMHSYPEPRQKTKPDGLAADWIIKNFYFIRRI